MSLSFQSATQFLLEKKLYYVPEAVNNGLAEFPGHQTNKRDSETNFAVMLLVSERLPEKGKFFKELH